MPLLSVVALGVGTALTAAVVGGVGLSHAVADHSTATHSSGPHHALPSCPPKHYGHHHHRKSTKGNVVVGIPPTVFIRKRAGHPTSVTTNTGYAPVRGDVFYVIAHGHAHRAHHHERRKIMALWGCPS